DVMQRLECESAERLRTTLALLESQRHFDQIATVLPIVLCVYDIYSRRIIYANPHLVSALNDTTLVIGEMTMDDLLPWMHPNDQAQEAFISTNIAALADEDVFEREYRVRDGEGDWRWYTTRSVVFARTPEGQVAQVLVAALDVTKRRQLEQQLRTFNRRLIDMQETERAHLARELHDEIGQALTGLNLALEVAAHAEAASVPVHIRNAQALVNDLTRYVRRLSIELRPAALDDLGLIAAIARLVKRYSDYVGVHIVLQHSVLDEVLPPQVALTAYRVVQEALTNVARHAGVNSATLQIWTAHDRLYVQVADNGRGFDVTSMVEDEQSSGLLGMSERVRLLDGILTIDSAPGAGTCVLAELPLCPGQDV
ncbi:MAG TPA: PAS domain-containing sensor histidine kinase, partial [Roseiflexaceae bacterium]|nr:PAS domain-containing sensor histidine kinase [Roseiflexaceae bacterium]